MRSVHAEVVFEKEIYDGFSEYETNYLQLFIKPKYSFLATYVLVDELIGYVLLSGFPPTFEEVGDGETAQKLVGMMPQEIHRIIPSNRSDAVLFIADEFREWEKSVKSALAEAKAWLQELESSEK